MVSLIGTQRPKPGNSQIWAGMYLPYHCMLYYVVWLLLEGAGTHAYTFRGEAWGGRRKVRERERERRKERRCFFLYIPFSMVCLVRRRLSSRVDPHIFSCWSPLIISFSRSSTESIGRTTIRLHVWHVVDLIFFFCWNSGPSIVFHPFLTAFLVDFSRVFRPRKTKQKTKQCQSGDFVNESNEKWWPNWSVHLGPWNMAGQFPRRWMQPAGLAIPVVDVLRRGCCCCCWPHPRRTPTIWVSPPSCLFYVVPSTANHLPRIGRLRYRPKRTFTFFCYVIGFRRLTAFVDG